MKDENIWLIVFAIVLVFFLLGGFGYMPMMYGYGYSGMWAFGWIFMTLLIVALVLLIAWLVKQLQKK